MDEQRIKLLKSKIDEWAEFLNTDLKMLCHYLEGDTTTRKIINREEHIAEKIDEIMGDAYMIVSLAKKLTREVE